ncbi:hypothetical protein Zmor_013397 [Zophobas morio]|uniref:Cadherin domain-containing protein n=1 Tax=Zophobas morio TaxID=2755281 RepID=A0AA38IH89_9CUCU|nr:hypothetical protein Zmor_013397 [Zophobas morio]
MIGRALRVIVVFPSPCFTKCDVDDPEGIIGWDTTVIVVDPFQDSVGFDLEFTYRGDFHVVADTEEEGAKYIDITADGSTLSIKTNDYFKNNYEEDQRDQAPASSLTIYRTLSITCDGTTYQFTIQLYVQDTNNHAPTFTQDTYTYTMPMPLVPNIDLTNFGDIEIIAEDIDFSNTKMTFTVDPPEYFAMDFKALGSRKYHAVLKVKQYVRYDKDLTLTITATDETDPFNTGTATVVIKKDNDFSQPDVPTFSELIFAFTYSNDDGNPAITPDDPSKQIVVTTSDSDQTEVSLSDETYFKAEYDKTTNIVAISVTNTPVESASESMMTLTLTVKLGSESSESAIIVKLPSNVVVIIPKFTAPYYTATYSVDGDGNPSLALDAEQEIAITQQTSNLDIELEGDDHFSIANVDGVWTLNADSPLDDEILKKGEDITLTLHATVTDENSEEHEGFGVVIVKLPPVLEVPRFVEANYRGQYKIDEAGVKDTVELTNGPINIVQTEEPVDIVIVDNAEYFALIQGSDGWTVDVLKKWEQVTEGGDIVLTLSATVTGADVEPGYSTLIIGLPAATEAPTFDKPYYTATYKTGTDKDTLEVQDSINVAGGPDTDVKILESENSDCFSISCDDGTLICQVTLVKDLPDDVITQGDDVILNIEANQPDSTETGLSILIISLETVIPKFSKAYYRAKYEVDENNNGVVTMIEQNITIDSPQDQAVDVAFSEVTDNFGLQQDPSNDHLWTVTVIQNLPDDVLQSGEDLILSLQAHIPGSPSSIVTTETLIIELPAVVTTPKFLNAIYSAEYESNGDENTVTLSNGPIQLTATENINVVFVDTYSENFDFTLDADPQITVKKPLGDDVISQYQEVLLTLQVSLEGSTDDVETTVIELKLPHLDIPKTLKFNNPSFVFSYIVEGDTHSIDQKGQTIRVTNGEMAAAVSIMEGTHSDNFKVRRNDEDDTYSIIIAKNLEQSVIDSEVDILLVLDASLALVYDDFATVLINLPAKDAGIPPQFKNTFYVGNYVLGEEKDGDRVDTFVIDGNQISLNDGISEEVSVTLAGTNSQFFKAELNDDKSVTVSLTNNLDLKTILGDVDIVLTLQATDPKVTEVGTATLVVKLPKEVTPAAFTQAHYTGSYDVDSDPDVVKINEAIELSGNYLDSTTVVLVTPTGLQDNFKLSDASPYTITLTSDIDDVHSYNEIVLTLEASIDGVPRKTSATVVIEVPAIPLPPKFSYSLYEFKYDSDTVTSTDGKTITTDPSDTTAVKVVIGDPYTKNFKISPVGDAGEYKFEVTTPLDQTIIDQNVEIFVQLDATLTGSTDTSSATVAIKMPEKTENVVPKFSNAYYKATYTHNDPDEDIVTIQDPVPITIASDQASDTVVNVIGQYQENFKAEFNTDTNSWGIKVTSKLDDTTLSLLELVIPLEAVLSGAADVGSAALVLSLPDSEKDPIPLFEKPSYTAQYSLNDDGTPNVTGDPIVVKVADLTYAEVTLADYTDYFVLTPNGDKSQWIISSSSKALDDDTLKNNLELVITLNAHLDNAVADGVAILVVTLPHD